MHRTAVGSLFFGFPAFRADKDQFACNADSDLFGCDCLDGRPDGCMDLRDGVFGDPQSPQFLIYGGSFPFGTDNADIGKGTAQQPALCFKIVNM